MTRRRDLSALAFSGCRKDLPIFTPAQEITRWSPIDGHAEQECSARGGEPERDAGRGDPEAAARVDAGGDGHDESMVLKSTPAEGVFLSFDSA